jgi:hypothetical protein
MESKNTNNGLKTLAELAREYIEVRKNGAHANRFKKAIKGIPYKLEILQPEDLYIPTPGKGQRKLVEKTVRRILENGVDMKYFGASTGVRLMAGPNKGKVFLADGQTRGVALTVLLNHFPGMAGKVTGLPVLVYETTDPSDIARIFAEVNKERSAVDPYFLHTSYAVAKVAKYVNIDRTLSRHGYQLVHDPLDSVNGDGVYGTVRVWDASEVGTDEDSYMINAMTETFGGFNTLMENEALEYALDIVKQAFGQVTMKGDLLTHIGRVYVWNWVASEHNKAAKPLWTDQDLVDWLKSYGSLPEAAYNAAIGKSEVQHGLTARTVQTNGKWRYFWMVKLFIDEVLFGGRTAPF